MPDARVAKGKVVFITYRIVDMTHTVLEQVDVPVGYVHGNRGYLLPKVEQALDGASAGEEVRVELGPHEAFGEHRADLTFTDRQENVPPEFQRIGAEANFEGPGGKQVTMRVVRIRNGKVTLDGNHPLAGKNLVYHVTVKEIRDATPSELKTGEVADASGLVQ